MNCEEAQELFLEFHDNQTDSTANVAGHLSRCKSCSDSFDKYRMMLVTLKTFPEPYVSKEQHELFLSYADGYVKGANGMAGKLRILMLIMTS